MAKLDHRLNAYRSDLADARLKGEVEAAKFITPARQSVITAIANIYAAPSYAGGLLSQALFGESVMVFETKGEWAWGQLQTDGYVGYFKAADLSAQYLTPTHWISTRSTFIYPDQNIKTVPLMALSYGSLPAILDVAGEFAELETGGFIFADHITPIGTKAADPLIDIQKFTDAPYLWGGRSSFGLDCSCLVQLVLHAAGIACPADSDLQLNASDLGGPLWKIGSQPMQAGDLVFWQGHVGMMLDDKRFIHSNGHHMKVVIDPLNSAIERIERLYAQPLGFRRLF